MSILIGFFKLNWQAQLIHTKYHLHSGAHVHRILYISHQAMHFVKGFIGIVYEGSTFYHLLKTYGSQMLMAWTTWSHHCPSLCATTQTLNLPESVCT